MVILIFSFVLIELLLQQFKKHGYKKIIVTDLLAAVMFIEYVSTVLSRPVGAEYLYKLELFWSYRYFYSIGVIGVLFENGYNILMFVPLTFLGSYISKKPSLWKAFVFGLCFSLFIEVSQLLLRRGCFELDDLFHNVVGALLGYFVYLLFANFCNYIKNRK